MKKIEPCPFCGSRNLTADHCSVHKIIFLFAVECCDCGARGPIMSYPDHSEEERTMKEWDEHLIKKSIDAWNMSSEQNAM